jgi:hypothetical protein
MNDLEPWKIWAVTGVLVCAILAITAARVRPVGVGGGSAEASTLAAGQGAASAAANRSDEATEVQYEANSSYTPVPSFRVAEYSSGHPTAIVEVTKQLYDSAADSGLRDDIDQDSQLNVTPQILGADDNQVDRVAANSYDPSDDPGAISPIPGDISVQQAQEASNIATPPLTTRDMNTAIRVWTAEGFNMQEIQLALAAAPNGTSQSQVEPSQSQVEPSQPQVTGSEAQSGFGSGSEAQGGFGSGSEAQGGIGSGIDEETQRLRNATAQAEVLAYEQVLIQAIQKDNQ